VDWLFIQIISGTAVNLELNKHCKPVKMFYFRLVSAFRWVDPIYGLVALRLVFHLQSVVHSWTGCHFLLSRTRQSL